MAVEYSWPAKEKSHAIGTRVKRLDGIAKATGAVYMDLGSLNVPGTLNTEIGMTPGPSQIDGFFCYQTYYSQSCSGAYCSIGAWFYNPCQGTSYSGVSSFQMPTTVSFTDTWDNQCAALEARSQ